MLDSVQTKFSASATLLLPSKMKQGDSIMHHAPSIRTALQHLRVVAGIGLAALLFAATSASAQISLGTAGNFGVLAGSAVTNTGASVIAGSLGVSPGTAVTGFPPGIVTPPATIHSADAIAAQAQVDLTTAYVTAAALPTLVDLTGTDLGGLTLTPGVYGFASSAQLTGTLTLDALGNPNAVFVLKMGSTLTTASGSSVRIINGGSSCNVFWQVGSSATLGTTTAFAGNILALTSITLNTGANLSGRALARNGATTLAGNNISACGVTPVICPVISIGPSALPVASIGIPYSQTVIASGGAAPYTYSIASGVLPTGLSLNPTTGAITGTPTGTGTFNFTIQGTDANGCPGSRPYVIVIAANCPAIALSPTSLPGIIVGTPYSQTISASGGLAPYTYSVVTGSLPPGLSLNPATGTIAGTVNTVGNFSFSIAATDANGCAGLLNYSIAVVFVPVTADIPTLSQWGLVILMVLAALIAMFRLQQTAARNRR